MPYHLRPAFIYNYTDAEEAEADPHWIGAKPRMAQPPPTSYQSPGRRLRIRHELEEVLYEESFAIQMKRCNADVASLEREIDRLQAPYTKWSKGESPWVRVKRRSADERKYGMTTEDSIGVVCRGIYIYSQRWDG